MASISSLTSSTTADPAIGDAPRILKEFFARAFPGRELRDEDDIFELGFGNSLFAIELVEFVERSFDLQIEDEDLDLENFSSIRGIARLVERKTLPRVG